MSAGLRAAKRSMGLFSLFETAVFDQLVAQALCRSQVVGIIIMLKVMCSARLRQLHLSWQWVPLCWIAAAVDEVGQRDVV